MMAETIERRGKRFVLVEEREYRRMKRAMPAEPPMPSIPEPDAQGLRPALETARAVMARDIIEGRRKVGWTQAELAKRAGVRVETISRLEAGKQTPTVTTVERIDKALAKAEREMEKEENR
jgi:DNA-binding XRE family transcriptional regulator